MTYHIIQQTITISWREEEIIIDFTNVVKDLTKAFGLTNYVDKIVKESDNKMPELPMTKYGGESLWDTISSNGPMIVAVVVALILIGLIFFISSKYPSGRLVIALFGIISLIMTIGVSIGTAKVATDVISKIESVDKLITENTKPKR